MYICYEVVHVYIEKHHFIVRLSFVIYMYTFHTRRCTWINRDSLERNFFLPLFLFSLQWYQGTYSTKCLFCYYSKFQQVNNHVLYTYHSKSFYDMNYQFHGYSWFDGSEIVINQAVGYHGQQNGEDDYYIQSPWKGSLQSRKGISSGLKTLWTLSCQRQVFQLGVSQHMHKITNLNWSSKLRNINEKENKHLETLNSKSEVSKSDSWKITSFANYVTSEGAVSRTSVSSSILQKVRD